MYLQLMPPHPSYMGKLELDDIHVLEQVGRQEVVRPMLERGALFDCLRVRFIRQLRALYSTNVLVIQKRM